MKKIVITQRLISNASYPETRECLDVRYAELIRAAGFLPIILPYHVDFNDYFSSFDIEGIVLTGGNDLNSLKKNILSSQRGAFEKTLIDLAIDEHIPIFGICRGLQIIAEYFDSTFKQVSGQIGTYHNLQVKENSKYFDKLSELKRINSYHNFAVKELGNGLIVSAISQAGMIKAIEHKQYPIFAQMWHSEREHPFNKKEVEFIYHFFNKHNVSNQ